MGDPRADLPSGLGGDQRQPGAAQDVQEALGWGMLSMSPRSRNPAWGTAQPGQRVMAAGAVVHEPREEQLHALQLPPPHPVPGAQPVAGRVAAVPVDGVDPGEPGGAQLIECLAPVIADVRVEETRQIRDVRPGCRGWPGPGMRRGVQGLRQAGEQLVAGTGQDGIQVRGDLLSVADQPLQGEPGHEVDRRRNLGKRPH